MPGSTPELALKTAVDADDNADYLTISLASSLQTLDATYNSGTGHTHNGAHQGGPIGTIPASAIPTGSIDSSKILDGSIATVDIANGAVTSAKLASDVPRENYLTNGGFEIWQRGTGAFTAGSAYCADRWQIALGGTSTLSVSRNTSTVDASVASAACTATYDGTNPAGIYQHIVDAEHANQFINKPMSVSVRVWASVANAVRLEVFYPGGAVQSAYHPGDSAWHTLTVSWTRSATTGNTDCHIRSYASTTFYVDNAMLTVGTEVVDYVPLHPADDLARCLRYYEQPIGPLAGSASWYLYGAASTAVCVPITFHATKFGNPTVTKVGTWTAVNCGQPAVLGSNTDQVSLYVNATALGIAQFGTGAAGAGLTLESNP